MVTDIVTGCDPSSNRLVVVSSLKKTKKNVWVESESLGKGAIETRASAAFDFMSCFCIKVHEEHGSYPKLFIEAPVVGRGGPGATIPQAMVTGATIAGAIQGGATVFLVHNKTWKKVVTGNGNSNKTAVSRWVENNRKKFYESVEVINDSRHAKDIRGRADQDIIDSYCINIYGWKRTEMINRLSAKRKKAGNG